MIDLSGAPVRRLAAWLGFPPGMGELIDQPTRRRLVLSLAASVVLSGLDMFGVLMMLPLLQFVSGQSRTSGALGIIDRLLGHPPETTLMGAVVGMLVLSFVGKDVFAIAVRRWQLRLMAEQELGLSVRMLDYYLGGPYLWLMDKNSGDKVWIINTAVSAGYTGGLGNALGALTELLTITFILASLTIVSPVVTAAAVVYFGLAAVLIQRVVRPRVAHAARRSQQAGMVTSRLSFQALTNAKEVKLRRAGKVFVDGYRLGRRDAADASVQSAFYSELPKYVMEILFVVGIGLLTAGVAAGRDYTRSLILLGVFAAAGSRIMPSAVRLLNAFNGMRFAREPLELLVRERRALEMARRDEESRVVTDEVPSGDIVLTSVAFNYPGRPQAPVLDHISLTVPAGQSVAFVGSSGAGKSTLVDVILGLLRPDAGTVAAGGVDIHANLPAWQRQLAVVPQDVVLFDDTLRSNIAFEMPDVDEKLADVVHRAQLSDLIAELPDGLDTIVGERGSRLSGGQRQRIGIARALYRDPTVLVLDEATSALDNETERRLTETIQGLRGSMTIIVVAHRLSTVRGCDQVVFMSKGAVAARGTFDELATENAEFAHLVRLGSLQAHEGSGSGAVAQAGVDP